MDGFFDYDFVDLQQKIDLAKDSDTSVFTEKEVDTGKLTEKREEIKRRELGQYGCAWDRYGLTQSEAKKAGINPNDCTLTVKVSNLMLDCAGRPRTTWCKLIIKSKDTEIIRVDVTHLTEIAEYISKKDFMFGFDKAGGLGHDGILKGVWLQYYLGARNGVFKMTHPLYAVNTETDEEISYIAKNDAKKLGLEPTDIEYSKKWADAQTKSLIDKKKWSNVVSVGTGVIATLIALVTAYGVIASALGASAAAAGGGSTTASTGAASTGTAATAAKGAGVLGSVGGALGKGLEWVEDNADKIETGAAVYEAIKGEENQYGISSQEAAQLAEEQKTLHGQSQLFKLSGTNAMIAAGIVFVIILGVFIWKRNR